MGGVTPNMAALMPAGKACAAFNTADDAGTIIACLNDSEFAGQMLKVSSWTPAHSQMVSQGQGVRAVGRAPASGGKSGITPLGGMGKGAPGKGSINPEVTAMRQQLSATDKSRKVWVGGLAPGTTNAQLKELFTTMVA